MSTLDAYALEYEDRPFHKPERVGRISTKMSKSTQTPEAPKAPKAKYNKTRGEHIKDVVIAMLVTGIVAFAGGVWFNEGKQQEIETAVKGAQTVATPEVKK